MAVRDSFLFIDHHLSSEDPSRQPMRIDQPLQLPFGLNLSLAVILQGDLDAAPRRRRASQKKHQAQGSKYSIHLSDPFKSLQNQPRAQRRALSQLSQEERS